MMRDSYVNRQQNPPVLESMEIVVALVLMAICWFAWYVARERFFFTNRQIAAIRSMNITAVRTSVGCPWQNGVAERWVGSCRRELLDSVIVLNEQHLRRLLSDYISYYHADRTHLGLGKGTPGRRRPSQPPGQVVARPRLGGLHHRYDRAA